VSAKEADRRQIGKDRLLGEGEGELQNTDYCIQTPGKKAERATGINKRGLESPPVPGEEKEGLRPRGIARQKKIARISSPHSYKRKNG
jgi:hypothetical protein